MEAFAVVLEVGYALLVAAEAAVGTEFQVEHAMRLVLEVAMVEVLEEVLLVTKE